MTLQANKPAVRAGAMELLLPIGVKGGPPVLLTVKADIQVRCSQLTQAQRSLAIGSGSCCDLQEQVARVPHAVLWWLCCQEVARIHTMSLTR